MEYCVGIDVSKETLDIHCVDAKGLPVSSVPARLANSLEGIESLCKTLPQPAQTVILYEATGVYGKKLSWSLPQHAGLVCEMNPKIIKNARLTMSQTKTDPVDARRIAGIARHLYLSEPQVLTRFAVNQDCDPELAIWISEYRRLHKAIARLRQQIDGIKQLPGHAAEQVLERMHNELVQLRASQKQVERTIEEQAHSQQVQWVHSIKGIGIVTAATVVNRIGSIHRFANADQLKAYLGIYPCIRRSGKYKGFVKLATHGDRLIRHQLFNCAKAAARFNPACRDVYNRLVEDGHPPLYAWTVIMRKLVQIIYGVLKNQTPWDPKIGLTANG
jgi:transposase